MAGRPIPLFSRPGPIVGCALASAVLVGALMAADLRAGLGLAVALGYGPLVLLNLPVGLALWVAVTFLERLPVVWVGPTAAGLLVLLAWFGTLRARRLAVLAVLSRHRRLLAALGLLLAWLTLSAAWARRPGEVGVELWQWYVAAAVLTVVATTVVTARHVRLVAGAFVAGAVLSTAVGLLGSATGAGASIGELIDSEGRLLGGSGDPNYLAAGIVPAIALTVGLIACRRHPLGRWALTVALAVLAVGLAASQSRGGLVALLAMGLAAVALARGRRVHVLAVAVLALGVVAMWFAVAPAAWERVTGQSSDSGRSELWAIGWRVFLDHPVQGVGLNNFAVESARYVREAGDLDSVEFFSDRPQLVHNVYLGLLADTGAVGLLLYLLVVGASLRAQMAAARAFEALGDRGMAGLARATLVATLGALCVSIFLSNGTDKRVWVLFGLGPAMLAAASSATSQRRPRGRSRAVGARQARRPGDEPGDGASDPRSPSPSAAPPPAGRVGLRRSSARRGLGPEPSRPRPLR